MVQVLVRRQRKADWLWEVGQRLRIAVCAMAEEEIQLVTLVRDLFLEQRRQHHRRRASVLHVLEVVEAPPERTGSNNQWTGELESKICGREIRCFHCVCLQSGIGLLS